jgi:hypothetical protein
MDSATPGSAASPQRAMQFNASLIHFFDFCRGIDYTA